MFQTVFKIIRKPRYALISVVVSWIVFTFAVWIPNWKLLLSFMPSSIGTPVEKATVLWGLYGSIQTNFTVVSASYTVIIAILFGINIALFAYFIQSRRGGEIKKNSLYSIGGLVSGIFGIGCAACGTFILTAVLSLIGGAWILALLPLHGQEFGIVGVLLLGYATYSITKKIQKPIVCKVEL